MNISSEWKEKTLSSGVVVLYGPFPHGMYWDIMERALEEHPDPEVPMREIDTSFGEKEQIEDPDDPAYKLELEKARLARWNLLGEAALEFCIEIKGGLEPWEPIIQRIADKYTKDPAPDDELGRKTWFLAKFGLRTREDWKLIGKIQRFSQIDDEEVRRKAESFPGDVEGPEGDGADAPGPAEEHGVAV